MPYQLNGIDNDKSLTMSASISDKPFNVHNELDLSFKGKNV